MSKRFIFPQQNGERKKAKLDVTISDHNFPLSQNTGNRDSNHGDTWGDDNDDEILLLASQACEQAYNDISNLPDYSICMQPTSTSTQLQDPGPSTSKTTFKIPTTTPRNITTNVKNKCNTISSPLPQLSSKINPKLSEHIDLTDDLVFSEKIFKGQDTDHLYRQLLQLQEENTKLKSENGKLLEKCVTKEGEASILRTQLKSCQMSVDNARMERIKAQEKIQMEWTDKLTATNNQMHDLRTQLDFKNLEIISIKEKCRMLESNKIKLTQVNVSNNDISLSHKNNTTINDLAAMPTKMVKLTSSSVQTDAKAHYLKLNKTCRSEQCKLKDILPLVIEPTTDQHSLLEYNEKLQKHPETQKCRIYSTFHRIPSTPTTKESVQAKVNIASLHEDLTYIAAGKGDMQEKYFNVLKTVKKTLNEVVDQLELVSQRITTAFQKEMDERYIDATNTYIVICKQDLLTGRSLYKDEQGILARRITAILDCVLQNSVNLDIFIKVDQRITTDETNRKLIDIIKSIAFLLDSTSCAIVYSGLLLSLTNLLESLIQTPAFHTNLVEVIKCFISARPMLFVTQKLVQLVRQLSVAEGFITKLCPGSTAGNLKLDYEQGVLLYKKDSCFLQVLLKQLEASLKCIERQQLIEQAVETARNLIVLYNNIYAGSCNTIQEKRCNCQLVLVQVIVYSLRICAVMRNKSLQTKLSSDLVSVCRCGIQLLYQCSLGDVDFNQLSHNEGHLVELCELMKGWQHPDAYVNMLSELCSTFQSSPEDMTSSFHRQAWIKSFNMFSITD